MKYLLSICLSMFFASSVFANESIFADELPTEGFPRVRDLNWLNQNFLNNQRNRADEIVRDKLAQRLKSAEQQENTQDNIKLLQRLIDENQLKGYKEIDLQSLGVVLGDLYVESHNHLTWQVYEDDLGKSHAVCVKQTKHCIFPLTMISRRVKVGLKPDLNRIYAKGYDAIQNFLPRKPFANQ